MAMEYATKWPMYAKEWDAMAIKPDRVNEFERYARFAIAHKDTYQKIEKATGVPWAMIACNHRRESSANFNTYLGNGQRLDRVTTIVPIGRGPFTGPNAFVEGGIDAYEGRYSEVKDWRLEKMLFWMEKFNGTGYNGMGIPSPYIWGGTNVQVRGKYTSDHHYNPTVWDTQPGCAPLLATIARLDPSVKFVRETVSDAPVIAPTAPPLVPPEIKPLPKSKTIWGGLLQWLAGGGTAVLAALNDAKPWLVALIAIGGSIGLFLVIKGRIDVQDVLRKLGGEDEKPGA